MTRVLLPLLALASAATAHFSLTLPKPLGDSDDNQATAPCGGYTASSSSEATDFHVEGDAIGMQNGHPQSNWLFRATLDQTAATGWTEIFPIVLQTGLGNFCEPQVAVPANFTGKKGLIGVVAHSPDGLLYANATITADFTSDPSLSALVGAGADASASSSPSSGAPAASTTPHSAAPRVAVGNLFSAGGVAAGLVASVAAALGGVAMLF
ncbi:hypothetical protein CSUB01_06926 [Colletotrichum sublineola]|uniref:Copper acquisition factor BIM1-like domain-containing protein n=1 Tax=Colletotrichum sublineola TaxID=1173701 RepID=A0A066X6Q3_COLSU|nr:hypothetical protein CSUB01_06926 [Colletotrichum sublineola]